MTVDNESRRSRRGLLTAGVGGVVAAVVTAVGAATIVRLRRQDGTDINMSITIDRPVSEVFDFVSDARNVLEWLPAAGERRKVTDGPIGVGTQFEATDGIGRRRIEHTQEIIEFEKDRLVRTKISEPWNGEYEIRVVPADGGTLLTVDVTGQPSGLFRLLGLMPASVLRRQFEQDYARLKDLLEGRVEPTASLDDATAADADPGTTPATIAIESEGESVGPIPEETAAT
jgi:uncharacterized protein YndB with AHSA1/START domain